jgi:hypothetical protein
LAAHSSVGAGRREGRRDCGKAQVDWRTSWARDGVAITSVDWLCKWLRGALLDNSWRPRDEHWFAPSTGSLFRFSWVTATRAPSAARSICSARNTAIRARRSGCGYHREEALVASYGAAGLRKLKSHIYALSQYLERCKSKSFTRVVAIRTGCALGAVDRRIVDLSLQRGQV